MSRTLNDCIGRPGERYRRLALRAVFAGCSTRLGSLRGPSFAADSFAASVLSRLARSASIRSMTLPVLSGCDVSHGNLLSFDFLLDLGLDAAAMLVGVRGRVELRRRLLLDELLGELELGGLHFGLRDLDFGRRPHVRGEVQLLHRQHVVDRPDQHDVRLAARRPATDGRELRFLHRFDQQAVRLVRAFVGREVVRLVEVHRIDRLDRHELRDLHRVGAGLFERLDLLRRELHVLVLGELVALDHFVALDDRAVLDADVLLPQARAAVLVQHVEGNRVLGLRRRVQLHGDSDQSERDRERADGAWCSHVPL